MKKYIWIFLIISPLFAFLLVGAQVYYLVNVWKYEGPDVIFQVKPGEGFSSINGRLSSQGIISSPKLLYRYAQFMDLTSRFKSGKFMIKSNSNMLGVMNTLTKGQPMTVNVLIPEGKNMYEIAKLLHQADAIDSAEDFMTWAKNPELMQQLGIPANHVEGYLYPNTYKINAGSPALEVLKIMVREFQKKTASVDFSTAPNGLSMHEVVILASIVEKETGANFERPMIAGVFHNRLRKKMRLQSDPTTIYGIYETFNGNLTRKDLMEETPYNTYRISALPIGPISNPGIQAIKAVLYPADHTYLFFVSQNDGTHVFTTSYGDHKTAVDKYQKNPANRRGKSWRNLKRKAAPKQASN